MSVYIIPVAVWLIASVPFSLAICRLVFGNRDFDE